MRIISGERRGAKLVAPEGLNTRPTDDRLKENIFNLICPIKSDSIILDLFAGSGQIGFEFLSRGSKECVFVEKNIRAINSIKKNAEKLNYLEKISIKKSDVLKFIDQYDEKEFDYIFIDPPYDDKNFDEILEKINNSDIIKSGTMIIIETLSDVEIDKFNIFKERVYGKRKIIILEVDYESDISRKFWSYY